MSGEHRTLPVPDGLEGERVDAGLARLFGLSRTRAADLAERGLVLLDGVTVGKSERLSAGGWLDVELPSTEQAPAAPPEVVPGLTVLFDDDDIVVVDTPDVVLVTTRARAQEVKALVDQLKATGRTHLT